MVSHECLVSLQHYKVDTFILQMWKGCLGGVNLCLMSQRQEVESCFLTLECVRLTTWL